MHLLVIHASGWIIVISIWLNLSTGSQRPMPAKRGTFLIQYEK